MASNQAIGLLRSEGTSHVRPDVPLKATDSRAGQRTEYSVHRTRIVIALMQSLLNLPPVCFGHTRFGR